MDLTKFLIEYKENIKDVLFIKKPFSTFFSIRDIKRLEFQISKEFEDSNLILGNESCSLTTRLSKEDIKKNIIIEKDFKGTNIYKFLGKEYEIHFSTYE